MTDRVESGTPRLDILRSNPTDLSYLIEVLVDADHLLEPVAEHRRRVNRVPDRKRGVPLDEITRTTHVLACHREKVREHGSDGRERKGFPE